MALKAKGTRSPAEIARARKVENQEGFTHAVLRIKDAASMSDQGRRDVAAWLVEQADDLVNIGGEYSATFTARYLS